MRLSSTVVAIVSAMGVYLPGCGSSDSCVSGSGPIVAQTFALSAVTGVDFQAAGEVNIVEGATQVIMVRGQENIVERLNTDVINGIWEIGFTDCVRDVSELSFDITLVELESVGLSGAGTINAETSANELTTSLSGAGTIALSGQTAQQEITLEGSGTIEAFDLVTAETRVSLAGEGTVNVTASEALEVDLSGAGSVFYQGDPELTIRISGAGTVDQAN